MKKGVLILLIITLGGLSNHLDAQYLTHTEEAPQSILTMKKAGDFSAPASMGNNGGW